ncbi:hypothetical protein ASE35_01360 [Lysobacter sp. Root916]|uniref:hypothetical protein n=1 Tax=Lysobacter sp. Root916 TaxID=1736606 RepID=UPI00070F2A87|nr:hypothetical protein [Lysobacter sp. Root916]KRD39051.1 hypothetical protein ASE35_01360 [Lysobacter sp. Root916]
MRNLIALAYFLFALLGCDTGGSTLIARATSNGHDTLHARTRVQAGIGRFECIASDSGRCHYALFARECAPRQPDCRELAFERFSMKVGDSREIVGLPMALDLCVGQHEHPATSGPDCKSSQPDTALAASIEAAR